MRWLFYTLLVCAALMLGLIGTLAITQVSELAPRAQRAPSPAISFTNIGTIETHNADEQWFVYARTHFFPIDGKQQVRSRLYYDANTTFVRQVPRMQGGVYYALEYVPSDPISALQAGTEIVTYYTTDEDGRLRAFYVISGDPLFASY